MRQVGDVVLLRSVYAGRVRFAFPHRLAVNDGERLGFYGGPGTPGVWMGRDPDGRYLERWVSDEPAHPHVWQDHHALRLVRPGDAHTVEIFWDEDWSFRFWYANLQAPLRGTPLGYDTTDWALDVWAGADGIPEWKDEADFAEAIALGVFTPEEAAAVRAEGERVFAERPWPTGYEDWRPPSDWTSRSFRKAGMWSSGEHVLVRRIVRGRVWFAHSAEGEQVVAEWPFPTRWEDWRPPPDWPLPPLPAGWDIV